MRHFDTANSFVNEIIDARIWAGLHYRFSGEAGVELGQKIAHYGLNHSFKLTN